MEDKVQYRLSKDEKSQIAQNLIDFLQKDVNISEQSIVFICGWIRSDSDGKSKAYFDVWDIVLKNYLPTTRPSYFERAKDSVIMVK